MALDLEKSPIHRLAREQNLPGARLADLSFPILSPEDFAGSGFMAPDRLIAVRFQPFKALVSSIKRFFRGG